MPINDMSVAALFQYLATFNHLQQQALQAGQSVVLVKAGPGTGKTKTLIGKIIRQLVTQPKTQIRAVTFTHQAAEEIKERLREQLADLAGDQPTDLQNWLARCQIGTFHQLALTALNQQKDSPLKIIESWQADLILRQLIVELDLPNQVKTTQLLNLISQVKNQQLATASLPLNWQKLIIGYDQQLKKQHLLDFDDLLNCWQADLAKTNQPQAALLLVDECQDLNQQQYQLLKKLAAVTDQLFLIGDPAQAIYGFRGAAAQIFEQLVTDFPDLIQLTLTDNYRSSQQILTVAGQLMSQPPLKAQTKIPGTVQLVPVANQFQESQWVTHDLAQKFGGTDLNQTQAQGADFSPARFKDVAILARTHRVLKEIEHQLALTGWPTQLIGSDSFYHQPEVKLIISCLQFFYNFHTQQPVAPVLKDLLLNPFWHWTAPAWNQLAPLITEPDLKAWLYPIPATGLLSIKSNHPHQSTSLGQLVEVINWLVTANFDSNWQLIDLSQQLIAKLNLTETLTARQQSSTNLDQLLNQLASQDRQPSLIQAVGKFGHNWQQLAANNFYDSVGDRLSLLTMHAAKGLEFRFVYVLGFEQGLIPYQSTPPATELGQLLAIDSQVQLAEERRLLFVALTRAKEAVYLVQAQNRWRTKTQPSQFLADVKPLVSTFVYQISPRQQRSRQQRSARRSQLGLF